MVEEAKVTEQPLTEDERAKLNEIKKQKQNISAEFGNLEVQRRIFKIREQEVSDAFDELIQSEQKFYDELREKYKSGTVNLDKGVFIPSP